MSTGTEIPWKSELSPDAVKLLIIVIVFPPIVTLLFAARLHARIIKKKGFLLSDYLCIAAWTFSWGVVIPAYLVIGQKGFGWHVSELNPKQVEQFLIVLVATIPFWALSTSTNKLSVLFFYLDIFENRKFKYAVWALIAITIGYCAANFIEPFVTCRPMAKQWNPMLEGVCGDQKAIYVSTACMNVIVDTIIVLLPATQIWTLQMRPTRKLGIILVFCGGLAVVVFTALRIAYIELLPLEDATYWAVPDVIYAELEVLVGVLVACLPIVQPSFKVCGQKIFGAVQSRVRSKKSSSPLQETDDTGRPLGSEPRKTPQDKYFQWMEMRYGVRTDTGTSHVVAEHVPKDNVSCQSQDGMEDGVIVRKGVSITMEPREQV